MHTPISKHVQPPPTGHQLNYVTDVTTKWLGSKCYFVSICTPWPERHRPTFEANFARMEPLRDGKLPSTPCVTRERNGLAF